MKKEKFDNLILKMSKCQKCINLISSKGTQQSLINFYDNNYFAKNIPSIWTDWYNRLDASIMIIGQDWGPYDDMQYFFDKFLLNPKKENWYQIIEEEKSMTKKMLTKYLVESANNNGFNIDNSYINKIFITNAIMCARKGANYRSNNINLKISTLNCHNFLKEQIDIVNPKIILTLGYYPLLSLSKIYDFHIEKTLIKCIEKGEIDINGFIIIPLYHPAAQINKNEQLKQYNKIWRYL